MTIVTSEVRLAPSSVTLPRVNLLPPEIAEKRAFRRVQVGLGCAVLAAVGVVGLLYTSASHGASSAQSDLDKATTQGAKLQSESAQYANVTSVYARAAAAQAMLQTAMGDEIRYSQLLNDLSLSVPSNVWLKNITYSSTPSAPSGAALTVPAGDTSVGSFTATAVAFSHDDVAVWLEAIAALKTYANPYFSTSTESLIGQRKVAEFSSTAGVTAAARSGRYNKPVGG